eukprot:2952043-Pyramimonas_sp.AAC.1
MADALSFPSPEEIFAAGYEHVLVWYAEFCGAGHPNGVKVIPKRGSGGWASAKTRPLHLKEGVGVRQDAPLHLKVSRRHETNQTNTDHK